MSNYKAKMTLLADAIRFKSNISNKLTIENMISAIDNISTETGADVTLGQIDADGNFQPLLFVGTEASNAGDPETVENYYGWNGALPSPTGGIKVVNIGDAEYYKCASVDTTNKTWTGYLAVLTDDVYTFKKTATTGLSYGTGFTPVIGTVYNSSATLQVKFSDDGLLYHNPLADLNANGLVVGTVSNETVLGIPCTFFSTQKSYITNTVQVSQSTAISFSLWLYIESGAGTRGGDYPRLFSFGVSDTPDNSNKWLCLTCIPSDNSVSLIWQCSDNQKWPTVSTQGVKDAWVHLACVCDNNELRLYKNGVQQTNTATITNSLDLPTLSTLYINYFVNSTNAGIDGARMAQFRVYEKVLTQDEITALANEFTKIA